MASHLLELATTLGFYTFSILAAGLALVFLYVWSYLLFFLVFYIKELLPKSKHKPPIAGTVFHQLIHIDTLYDYYTSIARNYPTFRLFNLPSSVIFTTDPANIEHVLKTNFSKYSKGQYNYGILKDLFGDGIFAVDGEKWRHQRKLASYEFSTKVLRDFSSRVFRTNAAKLATKVSESVDGLEMIDMQDLLMKTTMDTIFKVGFGVDLNTLSESDELGSRFSKAFDESNLIVFWRYVDVFWEVKRLFNIGREAELKKNIKVVDDFVFQLIRHKREQLKSMGNDRNREDILSRFLLESEKDPEKMTDRYLRDIILNFLIAGKDTSANTLTWFLYMLCKHPLVQEKVAREIEEATESDGDIDINRFATSLKEAALERMPYLHAALTETLRLYPAIPMDGKSSDEDDVLPDGFKVNKGDQLNYLTYSMGRMTCLWGDDAEDFRPERWLENGSFRHESPFKFVVFQAGPRICLGKEFAYRQMKILAVVLLHFFKFKLGDEKKKATYRTMFTLHMDKGLHLFADRRSK